MNLADFRARPVEQVGGSPSATQDALITRATMLMAHLGRMDRDALSGGAPVSGKYIAMQNALTRVLVALGADDRRSEPAEEIPSLADLLAG